RDAELRRRVRGVERGAEARAARAEDQDVGLGGVDHPASRAMIRARPTGPVQSKESDTARSHVIVAHLTAGLGWVARDKRVRVSAGAEPGLCTASFTSSCGSSSRPGTGPRGGCGCWSRPASPRHSGTSEWGRTRTTSWLRSSPRPPLLRCARPTAEEVVITYTSPRRLCALARGIIRGVARHYGEPVTITETTCMHRGAEACTISIRVQEVPPA